jgi:hypothetical protein
MSHWRRLLDNELQNPRASNKACGAGAEAAGVVQQLRLERSALAAKSRRKTCAPKYQSRTDAVRPQEFEAGFICLDAFAFELAAEHEHTSWIHVCVCCVCVGLGRVKKCDIYMILQEFT